ncbi:glycosyltransferase family 1 protein [bacterium]|nr:glycosyltransferase family 1 protein [bacterium]
MTPAQLKIAMVSPTLGTAFGLEQVLMLSVQGLRERGHEVFLIGESANESFPEGESKELISGLFSTPTLLAPQQLARTIHCFEKSLESFSPDIVHFLDQPHAEIIKTATSKYPCVLTAHTVSPTCPASHRLAGDHVCQKKSGWKCLLENRSTGCLGSFKTDLHRSHAILDFKLKKTATHKMKAIIAISQYVETTLLDNGFSKNQVKLIYNPLPEFKVEHKAFSPAPLILSACRLVPLKGIEYAIRALKLIEHLSWEYRIVGDGPLKTELQDLVKDLNLESRVIFLGKKERKETLDWMASAEIFLQPNIGPEGFGLSVAEAQALGTPTIAFDTPALNEIIENGKTGYLVTSKDTLALSQAIQKLLVDTDHRSRMSELGKSQTPRKFSKKKFIDDTLSLYQEVVMS